MNYIEILNLSQKELKKCKIPSPSLDCEILLSKVLNVKREYLLTFRNFYDILTILTFFILGILIFIFAIGTEHRIYSQIGIGIIWTLLLLSTNLSIKKF